jgi:hypothetical protein
VFGVVKSLQASQQGKLMHGPVFLGKLGPVVILPFQSALDDIDCEHQKDMVEKHGTHGIVILVKECEWEMLPLRVCQLQQCWPFSVSYSMQAWIHA